MIIFCFVFVGVKRCYCWLNWCCCRMILFLGLFSLGKMMFMFVFVGKFDSSLKVSIDFLVSWYLIMEFMLISCINLIVVDWYRSLKLMFNKISKLFMFCRWRDLWFLMVIFIRSLCFRKLLCMLVKMIFIMVSLWFVRFWIF